MTHIDVAVFTKPTYMPRPGNVAIGAGHVGQGVIATELILKGHNFGVTHIYTECPHVRKQFPDGWVRVGIGGWYNQAARASQVNCTTKHFGDPGNPKPGDYKILITLDAIAPGEELCVGAYTLYLPVAPAP